MVDKWLKDWQLYEKYNSKFSDVMIGGILSLAKGGESKYDDIKTTLKDKCGFMQADAGLMAQWFVDNFKETTETIPKGKYDLCMCYAKWFE